MDFRKIGLVIFSAIATLLSFPPFPFGPLIFISLVPLYYAIEDFQPFRAFRYGMLWGVIFFLGYLFYIAWVTIPGMIATVLILSLFTALACMFFVKLLSKNKIIALLFVPSWFVTWNWLFTMSDFNYPWADIGYALGYFTRLIQAADIGGIYLISLAILVSNMLLYASISPKINMSSSKRYASWAMSICIVGLLLIYGTIRLNNADNENYSDGIKVGVIQGNVTADVKWKPDKLNISFERYFGLSTQAANDGAEIIFWPETAIPAYLVQDRRRYRTVKSFVDNLKIPVLTGIPYYEEIKPREYIYYNSALYLEPDKDEYGLYKKIHLVPMSEKIPLSGRYKILKEIRLGQADWTSGEEYTMFEFKDYKFATVICIESVFPGFCREFAQRGAQFLVVITNDMWFGNTPLMEQHSLISVFRAIENRLPVVRAANTGVSLIIDKWGRIINKSDIYKEQYLSEKIYPENSKSIYGKFGNLIPKLTSIITLFALIIAFRKSSKYT